MATVAKTNNVWNKQELAKAEIYQRQVARENASVNSQLNDIERYDPTFHPVAKAASKPFLELSEKLQSYSFLGKKKRAQFITPNHFQRLLVHINAAVTVWNITMQSPQAKMSMDWARFRQQHDQIRLLKAWNEQPFEDHPDNLLATAGVK